MFFCCRQESPKPRCTAAAMLCSPVKCMELPGDTKHPETLSDANRFLAVIETDKLSMSPSRLQTDTVLPQTCKLHILSLGMPSNTCNTSIFDVHALQRIWRLHNVEFSVLFYSVCREGSFEYLVPGIRMLISITLFLSKFGPLPLQWWMKCGMSRPPYGCLSW